MWAAQHFGFLIPERIEMLEKGFACREHCPTIGADSVAENS